MRLLRAVPAVTVLVLAWLVVLAPPASAHALLERSSPAAGASLARPPSVMLLYFTEAPDPRLSTVALLNSAGRTVPRVGSPVVAAGNAQELRIALPHLAEGVYTVNWRTVSKVDGHITNGSFAFGIGVRPPPGVSAGRGSGGASLGSGPDPAAVVGLWLLYWGLALIAAAGVTGALVFRWQLPGKAGMVIAAGWLYAAVGLILMTLAEQAAADVPFGELFASATGRSLVAQAIALGACGVVVLYVARRPAGRKLALLAAVAAAALFVHAQAGHAEAQSSVRLLNVADQWLHMLGAAVWVGGLVWLLLGLRGLSGTERASAVRRFSQLALGAVLLVAVTGVLRAVPEVGSLGSLVSTSFGIALLVKTGLFGVLMAVAWWNRYRLVPSIIKSGTAVPDGSPPAIEGQADSSETYRAPASRRLAWIDALPGDVQGRLAVRWLRKSVRSEVTLAAIVLVVAAVLSGLPPASDVQAAQQETGSASIVVTGSDFATTARIRLTVTPGTTGRNQFTVQVLSYGTRVPLPARKVSLEFSLSSNPNVTSTLSLTKGTNDTWKGLGTNLSIDGQWHVDVVVQEAATAIDVPLRLRTRQAA
jgi:copper transport protein